MSQGVAFARCRTAIGLSLGFAAVLVSAVEQPAGPPPAPSDPVELGIEAYRAPKVVEFGGARYPKDAERYGHEGWVIVNLMVDPRGKAYEMSVVDSLGGPAFEREAIGALTRSVFEPARSAAGKFDAAMVIKVKFSINGMAVGASPQFVRYFEQVEAAIRKGDRARADRLLAGLQATNLYEDAFRNLALFQYHKTWGTSDDQVRALRAAIAGENGGQYLRRDNFFTALNALLVLEIQRNELGAALETWKTLSSVASEPQMEKWRPVIQQIEQARSARTPLRHFASLERGTSGFHPLFHPRFEIQVSSGRVDELKLRCEKSYVMFRWQPDTRYTIEDGAGSCMLEVVGDPGTRYEVVES